MPLRLHAAAFEDLYARLNRRCYVVPDPLQFLYDYPNGADREIVALVASALAYGRVKQILRSVSDALGRLGPRPGEFVSEASPERLRAALSGFKHRFSDGANLAALLTGAAAAGRQYGSLQRCFLAGMGRDDETVAPAASQFAAVIRRGARGDCGHLLSDPARGSACKRLHLMFRWLVRRDDVDPGGWDELPPAKLIVPLDTHMHRLARQLGATSRRAADARTAMEATAAFRVLCPSDPVKYDFALTRLGIRADMEPDDFLARCGKSEQGAPRA
ncbi:MAG: TIGR02757 family protein [Planctomycetota bacterium]|nr:TIGR02757 family protein [Planctomycetota bacterium]